MPSRKVREKPDMKEYWGVENAGIFTANGRQNKSKKKRQELYRFGKSL